MMFIDCSSLWESLSVKSMQSSMKTSGRDLEPTVFPSGKLSLEQGP